VPIVEVALLRSLPHFADLPGPGLEILAGELECVRVLPGDVVIRQEEEGDRFTPSRTAKSQFQLTVTL
jgi:hypothetical protein